jgi:crossover junction endodeoxyribonuclease RuvC
MIIIGIDPGSLITGYGIIQHVNNCSQVLDFGTIRPPQKHPIEQRYYMIYTTLDHLLAKFKPDVLSVETQFVNKNVQSAIKLGMARGSCIIAAAKHQIPVVEYAPTRAKKAVVGKGQASKLQVHKMVRILLNLEDNLSEDAADALALALCHVHAQHLAHRVLNLIQR